MNKGVLMKMKKDAFRVFWGGCFFLFVCFSDVKQNLTFLITAMNNPQVISGFKKLK